MRNLIKFGLITLGVIILIGLIFGAGFLAGRLSGRDIPLSIPALQRSILGNGSHGAAGTIDEIQDKTITLTLRDGTSQQIITDNNTRIERNLKRIALSDLKVGERIIIVGAPDARGNLKARMIRVADPRAPTPTPKTQ